MPAVSDNPVRRNKDCQGWPSGVSSFLGPQLIKDDQARWAENAVFRGGLIQTRPGFKSLLALCTTEAGPFQEWWVAAGMPWIHPQFFTIFRPTNDVPYIVFAISGSVWFAKFTPYGFEPVQRIQQLSFDQYAEQIVAVKAVQSVTMVQNRTTVISPINVLFMQDGSSRCGYWTGTTAGHLNPQNSYTTDSGGNIIYTPGYNQTPIGKWMAWIGNRLWVFRGNEGYASDLNNPFSFTERLVLTNVPTQYMPGDVTGCIGRGTSGVQQDLLFVFTDEHTVAIRAGIQDRTVWRTTDDFQRTIFSDVGCVAGKSPINHQGLLYWYTADGVVCFDSTGTVYSSQALMPIDYEMSYSKLRMSPDQSTVCACSRSSYVMWSVPVGPTTRGRCYNAQTQVLDRMTVPVPAPVGMGSPATYGITSWQGIWTGIRPIEWATFKVFGQRRTLCMSMDYDGVPRVWEAFQGNRCDNGQPIDWMVETKTHPVSTSPFDYNRFSHFKLHMDQIKGNLTVRGLYRGLRGQYHELLDAFVTATPGSIMTPTPEYTPMDSETDSESFAKQTREFVSKEALAPEGDPCQSDKVETPPLQDAIDRAFSLLLYFSGVGAISAYRVATDLHQESQAGAVMEPETGFHILPEVSCPEFIAGLVPEYELPDAPASEAVAPYIPHYRDLEYRAPVDPCPA